MRTTLTPWAERILDQLYEMANDSQEIVASFTEIAQAAQVSRTLVTVAIRELKAAQVVQQVKGFGVAARYRLLHGPPRAPVEHTRAQKSTLEHTRASDESDLISDDDDGTRQKRERISRLLSEFLVEEPSRSYLAEILIPLSQREADMRAICEKTVRETVWKNKPGVIVRRLKAFASGQQDPLPVFASVLAAPPSLPRPRPIGRKTTTQRRPQVPDSTEEQREAAREEARKRIAERAERRAREAVNHGND